MGKGSQYERDICRQLSLWWTEGKDDSVFWRTSQSGGRATQRAKFGKQTFGHYGDIAAVNPIGLPLLQLFTIELKRGRSHGCPNDLLDCKPSTKPKPFEQALMQAREAAQRAGTPYWMLICRRDGRVSMVYLQSLYSHIGVGSVAEEDFNLSFFRVRLSNGEFLSFVGLPLESFLARLSPQYCIQSSSNPSKRRKSRFACEKTAT